MVDDSDIPKISDESKAIDIQNDNGEVKNQDLNEDAILLTKV